MLSASGKFAQSKEIFKKLILEVKAKIFVKNLQSPVVILNHFLLRCFGDSSKHGDNRTVYAS